jgi:hypothetical protein
MDPFSIISIILISGLICERILKHFKKSKCCGYSVEFDTNASAPDLTKISEYTTIKK